MTSYTDRINPDTWRHYSHEELVQKIVQEVIFADARESKLRQLLEFQQERSRKWAAGVWAANRRGALVITALEQAQREGRKTIRIKELLETT